MMAGTVRSLAFCIFAALAGLAPSAAYSAQPAEALSSARQPRDARAVAEFKRRQPCPVTKVTKGACDGWHVDHIRPLCDGGQDTPTNMQWLTVAEHKIKTRSDLAACRNGRPAPLSD